MRGGGGGFAVVTAIEMGLVPAPEIYAGTVIFPGDSARDILQSFREWTEGVPDELTSFIRLLHLPPLPQIPEPLRDRDAVAIGACYLGSEDEGVELLAPVRGLAEPLMDSYAAMPPSGLVRIAMDPEEPVPGMTGGRLLRDLDERAIDAFVDATGPGSGSPLLAAELRHIGGALSQPVPGAGALSHLDAGFTFGGIGMVMAPEMADAIMAHLARVKDALEPWVADGAFFNFVEQPLTTDQLFPSEVARRLSDVKREWDPENVIRSNHAVPTA
jgi:hypothetical protein